MLSKIRHPFSALSHYAGAAAALVGSLALIWSSAGSSIAHITSLLIYGCSLCGMFLASATYHTVRATPKITEILRKIDHSAIYLLIAGSYTPFCIIAFTGFWKWGMLAMIWSLAVIGIFVKIFFIRAPRWLTAGVYIIMGWLSAFAVTEITSTLPAAAVAWLVAGGIIYTLGALIYITKKADFFPNRFGFHEVWHIFVLLGAFAHFFAIKNIL